VSFRARLRRLGLHGIVSATLLAACASPPPPAAGTGTLFGTLRLVPRQGLTLAPPAEGSYSDPRLRHARLVDYEHPGFAVVFLEGKAAPSRDARLAIRGSARGPSLEPAQAALALGGRLRLFNATGEPHVVSLPAEGLVRRLAPREEFELALEHPGPQPVFLLDAAAEALIFAAPGPFALVAPDGGWELRDLPPGSARLRAWHPRFPGVAREVEVVADSALRLELELAVDRAAEEGRESAAGGPHAHHPVR
jgi:hypothetical protein